MAAREYPSRPLVGVGVVVLRRDAVLLIRRGRPPSAGEWSLPGGAQKLGETAEEAARRELAEETGLRAGPFRLVGNVDSIHPDQAGRIRFHYTILDFACRDPGGTIAAGGDAQDVRWIPNEALSAQSSWPPLHDMVARARLILGDER